MIQDVLYLMIVNAPTSSTSSGPAPYDGSPAPEHFVYPYRQAKRIKVPPAELEPDPSQQQRIWTPNLEVGWLPNERYQPPRGYQSAPGRSPPPAYGNLQGGTDGGRDVRRRREEEYCVPTL